MINEMNNDLTMGAETTAPVLNEVVKPYTLRKLRATEFFPVLNIMKKIGFNKFTSILRNEETVEIFKKLKTNNEEETNENTDLLIGMGSVLFEIAEIIISGMADCEDEVFNLLSSVSGMPINHVKQLEIDVFTGMIIDLVKENVDFIKAVSKFLV